MDRLHGNLLFATLPAPQSRLGCFATSFSAQAIALLLLGTVTLTVPQVQKHFDAISLVAPASPQPAKQPVQPEPAPIVVKRVPRIQARVEAPAPPQLVLPLPALPKHEVVVNTQAAPLPRFESVQPAPQQRTHQPVQTNVFGSSAEPTLPKMAAAKVQTGGFGDPNGVTPNPNARGKANIGAVGSFDLPSGSGYGNGAGGARGKAGVIAGTGFGSGVAEPVRSAAAHAPIQTANFDPAPVVEQKKAPQQVKVPVLPVAIQEKPTPQYTAEAREARVEGEVLLQVLFTADGRVRVLRVVRGLGHGLDEAATRAAEKIRFAPAQREGLPVDSTAMLHIVFQLS